jgi:hypothetical protein
MNLDRAARFVWENARHLERAVFAYQFSGAPGERIVAILRTYQNEDGGFGHALEPDLRAPDSQPLFVEYGLRMLYACGLRDPEMAYRACDFLARHADLEAGIPTLLPSASRYPRAPHWDSPGAYQPSFDRLVGLVGLAAWQGITHPWLEQATAACRKRALESPFRDAHTILTAFCLAESAGEREGAALFDKLADELFRAGFFSLEAPVKGYALNPLHFAPAPTSACRRLFTGETIAAHLEALAEEQEADGGWPIQWEPPGPAARLEWRAVRTVDALAILRAYGQIS